MCLWIGFPTASHILLDSIRMCGIMKFKPTIKSCYTINCIAIVRCKICVCAFNVLFGISNRSTLYLMCVVAEIS